MNRLKYLVVALVAITNCSHHREVPDDFSFTATYHAIQPGAGGEYAVSITPSNNKDQFLITVRRDTVTRQLMKDKKTVQELYSEIMHQGVFKLKDEYANMSVLDGEKTTISIVANGKKKEISLRNTVPHQLENVFKILNRLTSQQ
jgi:hypothetical protein